jgi:maleylacetoacetate isomerase
MKLYGYFRSSAAYRVRIALQLKKLEVAQVSLHLRKGEQRNPEFLKRNPQGLVPALELDDGTLLTQSMAIVEYLDESFPTPPLLPSDAKGRARVRALAQAVACDIHPIDNLRVLTYITKDLGRTDAEMQGWYNHWIQQGFEALEAMLAGDPATGKFCHGDQPGLADICLVPQVLNAGRYQLDLSPYPTIKRINAACIGLPAFAAAHPSKQPDFEP